MVDDQYSHIAKQYHTETNEALAKDGGARIKTAIIDGPQISDILDWSILDVGCGTGIHVSYLAEVHPEVGNIIGIDVSPQMIEIAQTKNSSPKIKYLVANMDKLPFSDNSFDLIFSRYSIHYSPNLSVTFEEISRVMKPGAKLYLRVSHPFYGLFLKADGNYMTKENVSFSVQNSDVEVLHPTYTIEEYINAIVQAKLNIVEMKEYTGEASHIDGYTVPTLMTFLLIK